MEPPSVVVIAFPHVYTTALAAVLRRRGGYDVLSPDVMDDFGTPPEQPFDVIVTSLPVPADWGRTVIRLPASLHDPVVVSVGDVSVFVEADPVDPVRAVLRAVELAVDGRIRSSAPEAIDDAAPAHEVT